MPVLIKAKGPRGGKTRARGCGPGCYNAKRKLCVCPCGGANHGIGLQKAIENTRKMQVEGLDLLFNEKVLKRPRDSNGRFIKKGSD